MSLVFRSRSIGEAFRLNGAGDVAAGSSGRLSRRNRERRSESEISLPVQEPNRLIGVVQFGEFCPLWLLLLCDLRHSCFSARDFVVVFAPPFLEATPEQEAEGMNLTALEKVLFKLLKENMC